MIGFSPMTSDRPYRIFFEHRPRHLYVHIQSPTTNYAIAKRYWAEILTMQRRRNYERILIDKDIDQSMHAHDVILLVTELVASGCNNMKLAILDRHYDGERCGFEEMIGTNRGMQVRICSTMAEAETWLDGVSFVESGAALPMQNAQMHIAECMTQNAEC